MHGAKSRTILEENLLENLRLWQRFPFQHNHDSKHPVRALQWSSQSSDLKPTKNPWQDLKTSVYKLSSHVTELQLVYKEELAKVSVSKCVKQVKTYSCRWNCSKRWFYKVFTRGWAHHILLILICLKKKLWTIFFPLGFHDYTLNVVLIHVFQALRDWVAIESDSSDILRRPDLHRMMDVVAQKLQLMGGTVQLVHVGEQEVSDKNHLFMQNWTSDHWYWLLYF